MAIDKVTVEDEKWLKHIARCIEGGIADILESPDLDALDVNTTRTQGNWDVLHLVSLNKTLSHLYPDKVCFELLNEINKAYDTRRMILLKEM